MTDQSIQRYARTAGLLFLITMIAGTFGELYVPVQIISSGDANATAENLQNFNMLFRLGFASYLIEAMCDIALSLILYVLLKPVDKNLALLAAFFGLVSTALFACAELFSFSTLMFIGNAEYLKAFSREQLDAMMMMSFSVFHYGANIFAVFYGIATAIRGYLIFRLNCLPKFLGALFMLAGLGFITKNFLIVLVPGYASDFLMMPMFFAVVSLVLWLLIKGVNVEKWQASAAKTVLPTG